MTGRGGDLCCMTGCGGGVSLNHRRSGTFLAALAWGGAGAGVEAASEPSNGFQSATHWKSSKSSAALGFVAEAAAVVAFVGATVF